MNATQVRELRNLIENRFNKLHFALIEERNRRKNEKRDAALAEIAKFDERFAKRLNALVEAARTAAENTPHVEVLNLSMSWDGTKKRHPSLFVVSDLRYDDDLDEESWWTAFHEAKEQAMEEVSLAALFDTDVHALLDRLPTVDDLIGS